MAAVTSRSDVKAESTRARSRPAGAREAPAVGAFLDEALGQRFKAFRKRLRHGLPQRRSAVDGAVHDLRTASRKLLSVLAAVERVGPRKAVRRLDKRVHRVLDRLGPLRDLTVQREMLARMTSAVPTAALRAFGRRVDEEHERSVGRVRRRLSRVDAKELRDDARRIRRRLTEGPTARATRRDVVKAVALAFSDLQRRRAEVDPTALESVHRMRISLKRFRYLVRSARPILTGVSTQALDALHDLQTTMGDLHDIEVLSGSLAAFAKGDTQRTEQLAPVLADLEAQHSGLLRSFLKTADGILSRWKRTTLTLPAPRRKA